jgi:glycosyltransferase involved in cell wall biosynthesis
VDGVIVFPVGMTTNTTGSYTFTNVDKSNLEGIAGALLQAMATGKVCLSTLAGGIGEYLIDSYNGFSIDVGDFQNFSKRLEYLYNLPQQDYKKYL